MQHLLTQGQSEPYETSCPNMEFTCSVVATLSLFMGLTHRAYFYTSIYTCTFSLSSELVCTCVNPHYLYSIINADSMQLVYH